MEHAPPIEKLQQRRSEVTLRLNALPGELDALERKHREYGETLRQQAPWWKKLSGNWADETFAAQREQVWNLDSELRKLKEEHSNLERSIRDAKKTKKRLLDAKIAQNAAESRKRAEAAEHEQFCSASISNLHEEFDRRNFYIQAKDYRRGNALDNYFREISSKIFAAFDHACAFCGIASDLTFDHYGITKNEGGNFALITADRKSIRLNIVVLCRGCNSAKAQSPYLLFFSDVQRERVSSYQRSLLDILLRDEHFLKVMNKWRI